MSAGDREIFWLRAELDRRADRIELQSRYVEAIERRLRELLNAQEAAAPSVTVADPIPPLEAAASNPDDRDAAYASAEPTAAPVVDESWWPRARRAPAPLAPASGWRNFTLRDQPTKVLGVSVCGLSRAVMESLVDTIAAQQTALRDFVPVFLTDSTNLEPFRRHGYVCEYFPDAGERARYEGSLSWAEYGGRRRDLLKRKWRLDEVVAIGGLEFGVVDKEPVRIAAPPSRTHEPRESEG